MNKYFFRFVLVLKHYNKTNIDYIQKIIKGNNLKVMPQRIGVRETIYFFPVIPKAEQIIDFIREKNSA